jgi:hypothetical protein
MISSAFNSSGSKKAAMSASLDIDSRSGTTVSFHAARMAWLPITSTWSSPIASQAARMA